MTKSSVPLSQMQLDKRSALAPGGAWHHGLKRSYVRLLIAIGKRSPCCGAPIVAWHHDKFYCQHCEGWLFRRPAL